MCKRQKQVLLLNLKTHFLHISFTFYLSHKYWRTAWSPRLQLKSYAPLPPSTNPQAIIPDDLLSLHSGQWLSLLQSFLLAVFLQLPITVFVQSVTDSGFFFSPLGNMEKRQMTPMLCMNSVCCSGGVAWLETCVQSHLS